jgi:LacI family transcriptional regulator
MSNPVYSAIVEGAEATVSENLSLVFLVNTNENVAKQEQALDSLVEHGVDGIILSPANGTRPENLTGALAKGRPIVLVARRVPGLEVDYVGADNIRGSRLVTERLLSLGHRRIGFVGGPVYSSAREERLQGFTEAHTEFGLQVDGKRCITTPASRSGGHSGIQALLSRDPTVTAAVCYNDLVALGAMLGLRKAKKTVGEEFCVTGFDDIEEARLWEPALTTVSIEQKQIGENAVRLIEERIRIPTQSATKLLIKPTLIERESCGKASEHTEAT